MFKRLIIIVASVIAAKKIRRWSLSPHKTQNSVFKKLINEGAKIIIMDGHEDGLVFVGHSLDDTGSRYLELIEQV